jgi:hypothetical protein
MKMTGRYHALPAVRRVICDSLYASRQLDLVIGQRVLKLGPLLAARKATPSPRPSLFVMVLKAFATVSARRPKLRRAFVSRPWHRLFQYDHNVFSVVVEKEHEGEKGLFLVRLDRPETMSLTELDATLRKKTAKPVASCRGDRNALRIASWPWFVRKLFWNVVMNWSPTLRYRCFGTMGFSVTAATGGAALTLLTPWTTAVCYDAPDADGNLTVRVALDHRVLDGRVVATIMSEVERELLTSIRSELPSPRKVAA